MQFLVMFAEKKRSPPNIFAQIKITIPQRIRPPRNPDAPNHDPPSSDWFLFEVTANDYKA